MERREPGSSLAAAGAAARLAAAVAEIELDLVPEAVRAAAKLRMLDALGVQLAAAGLASSAAAAGVATDVGRVAEATLVGGGRRVGAVDAALVNGTLTHALDFDDTHLPSQVHVCGCVLPAALALAERQGAPGSVLLEAFIRGAEVAIRVGMAAPGLFNANGFHATAICGTFGAAAAAARVLGLGPRELTQALAIAGSQAAGPLAFLDDGAAGWSKRLHPGWAAHSGCYAALLAARGWTGPPLIFEAPRGLYATHLRQAPDLGVLTAPFDRDWETPRIGMKPYPTAQFNVACMDAARRLADEEGVAAADIARIECLVPAAAVTSVCEPPAAKRRPDSGYAAKFSLPFGVALMLVRGRATLGDFDDETARDPAILAVCDRVGYAVDARADFPRCYPGRVRFELRDGRRLERDEPINRGHPDNPLTEAEVRTKFRGCLEGRPAAAVAARLESLVLGLEAVEDVRDLGDLLIN